MSSHSFPTHKQKLTQSQEGGRRKERQRMKAFTKACIFSPSLSLSRSLFDFLMFLLHTQFFFFYTQPSCLFFCQDTKASR